MLDYISVIIITDSLACKACRLLHDLRERWDGLACFETGVNYLVLDLLR